MATTQPYVRGFHDRETSTDTSPCLPLGDRPLARPPPRCRRGPSTLIITAAPRPDGVARPVQVVVNGIPLAPFTPQPGSTTTPSHCDPSNIPTAISPFDLISDAQPVTGKGSTHGARSARRITNVRAVAEAGGGLVKPPLRPLAAWFVIAPPSTSSCVDSVCARRRRRGRRSWACSLARRGSPCNASTFALFAPRVAFLLVLAYALLVLTDLIVPRLFARGGVTIAPATGVSCN